jgi:hypothetical protein
MLTGSNQDAVNLHHFFRFGVNTNDFWFGVNRITDETVVEGIISGENFYRKRRRSDGQWFWEKDSNFSLPIGMAPFQSRELLKHYQNAYDEGMKPRLLSLLKKIDGNIRSMEQAKLLGDEWTIKFENDAPNPVDIASMGQGFIRAFSLYCQLLAGKKKIALIDEVEIGMHHKSLPVMWEALRDASEEADVQIFATTHSYECIQASLEVFKDRPEMFQLIRLEKAVDGVQAKCIPLERVNNVLDMGLEVR